MRVATGDFLELVEEGGETDAYFAILETIAHEIVHYFQWLHDKEFDEDEAVNKAEEIVDRYADFLENI